MCQGDSWCAGLEMETGIRMRGKEENNWRGKDCGWKGGKVVRRKKGVYILELGETKGQRLRKGRLKRASVLFY